MIRRVVSSSGKSLASFTCSSRRRFLTEKATTASHLSLCPTISPTCHQESCKLSPCWPQPRVVIIGAGMAGLSAAQRLTHCGLTNFIVLEGKDGPGGRIQSCWLDDSVGELGAQWIKGGSVANPVYSLAAAEGLLNEPFLYRTDRFLCATSEGRAIESHTTNIAKKIFEKVNSEASAIFCMDTDKKEDERTLKDFFVARVTKKVEELPEDLRYDVTRVFFGFLNDLRVRWGARVGAMSVKNYGSFMEIPGRAQGVPKGLLGTLGYLIKGMPKSSVKYCTDVVKINWGQGNPRALVEIDCGEPLPADYVIITVSLGVLKERLISMFEPMLPDEKRAAIKRLGFGYLNKIIAHYKKPFWAPGEGFIRLAWSEEELLAAASWTTGISTVEEMPGSNNKLMATVGGHEALKMETCSDEEVAETFTHLIRDFTGDKSILYPTQILRSNWVSDKFFRGAVSYMGPKSEVFHQCDLGTPAVDPCNSGPPVLLFAGEATAPGLFSTVQGAHASGIREADRIINMTMKLRGPPKQALEC